MKKLIAILASAAALLNAATLPACSGTHMVRTAPEPRCVQTEQPHAANEIVLHVRGSELTRRLPLNKNFANFIRQQVEQVKQRRKHSLCKRFPLADVYIDGKHYTWCSCGFSLKGSRWHYHVGAMRELTKSRYKHLHEYINHRGSNYHAGKTRTYDHALILEQLTLLLRDLEAMSQAPAR